MDKVVNQGTISWLVTKDGMGMVNWVVRGKLPDTEEFVLARGFNSQIKAAQSDMANEIVAFVMKRRDR